MIVRTVTYTPSATKNRGIGENQGWKTIVKQDIYIHSRSRFLLKSR